MVRALLSPRMLALHAIAIVAVAATIWLGIWQYDAWSGHRHNQSEQRAHAPAKPLHDVLTADSAFPKDAVGQPVRFEGRWLDDETLFVAHKRLDGRSGYWVVTPVAVCTTQCDKASALLVVRGFAETASAPSVDGRVSGTGWLQPGETGASADPHPGDDVLPQLRIADAISHVRQDLYGGYVIAKRVSTSSTTGDRGLGAVPPASLPKAGSLTALRNLLYASQWWLFGVFGVFIWWRWCRDEMARVASGG